MAEQLLRRTSLGLKLELSVLTGGSTFASTGTAVSATGSAFQTELVVGDIIGNPTNGWRRVMSITDDTNLVVNAAFITDMSASACSKSDYGVDPTIAAADIIEFNDDSNIPRYKPDMQERNVVRNTYSQMAKVRGAELNAEGALNLELHGSGTAGVAPEASPLWECALGEKNVSTASTTHATTACTTTTLELVTSGGAGFKVGDAVLINGADLTVAVSGVEVAWVTSITDDELTVSPAFSSVPKISVAVGAGVHYKLGKNDLKSFYMKYWQGDANLYASSGCKVQSVSIGMTTGEIIKPAFAFMAKDTKAPTDEAYSLGAPSYDDQDPLVALMMAVRIAGVTYHVSDLSIELANEIYKRTSVTTSGIQKGIRTARTVSGSFSLLYENKDIEDAFRADTTAELIAVAGDTAGNVFGLRLGKIRYTETPVSVDSGLFKYDVSFEAEMTAATGEDEVSSYSFL